MERANCPDLKISQNFKQCHQQPIAFLGRTPLNMHERISPYPEKDWNLNHPTKNTLQGFLVANIIACISSAVPTD